jgi:hypothetical protein
MCTRKCVCLYFLYNVIYIISDLFFSLLCVAAQMYDEQFIPEIHVSLSKYYNYLF